MYNLIFHISILCFCAIVGTIGGFIITKALSEDNAFNFIYGVIVVSVGIILLNVENRAYGENLEKVNKKMIQLKIQRILDDERKWLAEKVKERKETVNKELRNVLGDDNFFFILRNRDQYMDPRSLAVFKKEEFDYNLINDIDDEGVRFKRRMEDSVAVTEEDFDRISWLKEEIRMHRDLKSDLNLLKYDLIKTLDKLCGKVYFKEFCEDHMPTKHAPDLKRARVVYLATPESGFTNMGIFYISFSFINLGENEARDILIEYTLESPFFKHTYIQKYPKLEPQQIRRLKIHSTDDKLWIQFIELFQKNQTKLKINSNISYYDTSTMKLYTERMKPIGFGIDYK